VTGLGLGCAAIGSLFSTVSEADAQATVDAAWAAGVRFFDVAPQYGHGLSERRLGAALQAYDRGSLVVSTKVGRLLRPTRDRPPTIFAEPGDLVPQFDFSRDGILRSIDESLERLGTDRIDVALVHDPDDHEEEARREAFPTLLALRDEGVVQAVGCGMNQSAMLEGFVRDVDLDCVLLAGRYTLLDRTGAGLLDRCAERRVGVVLGGVFNSGILVDPDDHPVYDYETAPRDLVERARRMRAVCTAAGTELPAAALQFSARHRAVTTVLLGARSAAELEDDVAFAEAALPAELWAALDHC
jgi:D-threo-aldose 1-dehydrogenase